jgi:hypothetical protein
VATAAGTAATRGPRSDLMSTFHHAHPHAHGRRGVHDHRHGHHGPGAAPRCTPVPWPHWFAVHRHVHPDPSDERQLTVPNPPGERPNP